MGISLIDSYICIINLFNMYQKFTNVLQDIKDFLPGGPNKKYIASFLFLFIWMALFDKNRWVTQWQLQRSIYKYEGEKYKLSNDIIRTKQMTKDVNSDIEKFGREEYLMTKNDEDLFIIAVE